MCIDYIDYGKLIFNYEILKISLFATAVMLLVMSYRVTSLCSVLRRLALQSESKYFVHIFDFFNLLPNLWHAVFLFLKIEFILKL